MTLAIFSRTYLRPNMEGVLDAVLGHGLQHVHFNLACAGMEALPDALAEHDCRQIQAAFRQRGLTMTGVSGTFNAIDPVADRRREMIRRCGQLIRLAPTLGTTLVSLCSGTRDAHDKWRAHPDNSTPEAWADLLATLQELLSVAEDVGVTLGIEPEQGNVIRSAALARHLLDELRSSRLAIIMDGANLLTPQTLPRMRSIFAEAFDLLGSRIVSVHVKDFGSVQALCDGALDYESYLRLVVRSGYTGALVMHNVAEAAVPSSITYLRQVLDRIRSSDVAATSPQREPALGQD